MKRCPYCGPDYSDEYSVCTIDQNPLESCEPKPPIPPPNAEDQKDAPSTKIGEAAADKKAPDGFRSCGKFKPFEADRLLKKFQAAGVRFQIDLDEKRVFTSGGISGPGYVTRDLIEIFVQKEDEQKAAEILRADWKV
jgi:hypothetical protein